MNLKDNNYFSLLILQIKTKLIRKQNNIYHITNIKTQNAKSQKILCDSQEWNVREMDDAFLCDTSLNGRWEIEEKRMSSKCQ